MTHQTETSPATIVTQADIDAARIYLQGTGPWKLDEIGIGPDDSLVQAFARHRQRAYDHGYYDGRTYDMGQPQTDALKIAREDTLEDALNEQLTDVEIEDALVSEGIHTWGPDGERFERMFAVVMKLRAALKESK